MTKKQLDQIIVVDVESTCWKGPPPAGESSEIIEIGICTLDLASAERRERESLLIKPSRSTVSRFCNELTTLTAPQVAQGGSFAAACQRLREHYRAKNRVWASYGDYDRRKFKTQCRAFAVPYPFGPTHINVKTMAALALNLPREIGMPGVLERLGLPHEGTHHRGDDDAWNISAILAVLIKRLRQD